MVAPPSSPLPGPVVLYDGECGVCDASVSWLLAHDPAGRFRYAPLQGDTAAELRARHPELPADLDSVVYVEPLPEGGERLSWRSEALFRIARNLPGAWRALAWLAVFPRALTDLAYRAFAHIRYLVAGRKEACRVPSVAERRRFLP